MDKSKVSRHVHAFENGTHRPCRFKVALTDTLGTQAVFALVDALPNVLSALCNGRRRIVENQLSEKVGLAIRPVNACPFLSTKHKQTHKNKMSALLNIRYTV